MRKWIYISWYNINAIAPLTTSKISDLQLPTFTQKKWHHSLYVEWFQCTKKMNHKLGEFFWGALQWSSNMSGSVQQGSNQREAPAFTFRDWSFQGWKTYHPWTHPDAPRQRLFWTFLNVQNSLESRASFQIFLISYTFKDFLLSKYYPFFNMRGNGRTAEPSSHKLFTT